MLVYLDSAHLALLERAPEAEAKAFWSEWHTSGCELALSLHHLQEIGQLADRRSAERRLKVLERFTVIRSRGVSFDRVLSMEIHFQLYQLAGYIVDVQRSARDTLFPVSHLNHLLSSLDVQPQFHQMRAALEIGADAANLSKEAARQEPAVDPDAPIDPTVVNSLETEALMQAALADLPAEAAMLMRQLFEQVRTSIIQHGTVRKGLEALYGLQDVTVRELIPKSDLAAVSLFFNTARAEAAEVCARVGLEPSKCDAFILRLNPYGAPGFALQLAAHRARQLHPKPDQASDQVDVGHLAFAPYADLAFVDKRTLGFINQESRDRPHLLAPEFTKNITRAGTLDHVAEAILKYSSA